MAYVDIDAHHPDGVFHAFQDDTDVLIVRTATAVNETLLRGTPVRFVGSTSIGIDHIDTNWLERQGVAWANAPGCNADGTAQYTLAIAWLACERLGRPLSDLTAGVIGRGNVGSRVQALFRALGIFLPLITTNCAILGLCLFVNLWGIDNLLEAVVLSVGAGVGFTLHSDFMVTDPAPLHMIEMAVTRRTWKEPDYVLAPQEKISVESAIRAVTSEAAWQLFSEQEIGSLETGKFADLVILDKDPRKVPGDTIKDIKVLETWMDGRQVYRT